MDPEFLTKQQHKGEERKEKNILKKGKERLDTEKEWKNTKLEGKKEFPRVWEI